MAAFDCVRDMYDVALKPRLLRTLVRDHLPDEKRPFGDTKVVLRIISTVKTQKLLSEYYGDSTASKKIVKEWGSAIAAWVDKVLMLASSNSPAKCWAGISLLGLTCQECSSDRFLESYAMWTEKLKAHIEPEADSHMLKVASCASLADLLLRLGQYPLRHGSGGCAEKLVQPLLKLLVNEDGSEMIWEAVVHLIGIMVTLFPSAIQRHYDNVEATIISKIFSGKCSNSLLEKLARCLAILPKSKGDEGTWLLLMQKILLFFNDYLKKPRNYEGIRLLVAPGKNPPPPLADYKSKALNRSAKTSIVSTMMICCTEMLKNSYPAQVSVPMQSLVQLMERVLAVDGSIQPTSLSFITSMQQELLCLELPVLHSSVLDLLIALTKGMRSQMLPRAAYIIQVITSYFNKCSVPCLRVKVYSVIKILLMTTGAGMAKNLQNEIMRSALLDLNPVQENEISPSNSELNVTEASPEEQPKSKKRKQSSTAEPPQQQRNGEVRSIKSHITKYCDLKIAALDTLETLFTVGGGALEFGRLKVDDLVISLAMNSSDHQSEELQLAALRALLASILSQTDQRPAHLARSLEVFRRGQVTGSKVGEFCAHAILVLNALIHPRVIPLSDYSTPPPPAGPSATVHYNNNNIYENPRSSARKDTIMGFCIPDSSCDVVKSADNAQDTHPTAKPSEENQKTMMLSKCSSCEESREPPSPDTSVVPDPSESPKETKKDMLEEDRDVRVDGNVVDATMLNVEKDKVLWNEDMGNEASDDLFPDIVDIDPDSDED